MLLGSYFHHFHVCLQRFCLLLVAAAVLVALVGAVHRPLLCYDEGCRVCQLDAALAESHRVGVGAQLVTFWPERSFTLKAMVVAFALVIIISPEYISQVPLRMLQLHRDHHTIRQIQLYVKISVCPIEKMKYARLKN